MDLGARCPPKVTDSPADVKPAWRISRITRKDGRGWLEPEQPAKVVPRGEADGPDRRSTEIR
jgi:hypothetical protein